MKKLLFFFTLSLGIALAGQAQENRAASPASKVEQRVGLTDITIEYSRPGVKERTIFADDGLVPFGKIWRTGANSATKITFSDDVKIAGQELAAGSYAILTIPTADEWTVNFYTHEANGFNTYVEKEPTLSVKATVENIGAHVESFLISIGNLRDYSATLNFVWENTRASVGLEVN